MRFPRWLSGQFVLTPLWIPLAGLAAALAVDRGPDGAARLTIFPLVLTLFDPLVWDSVVNSLVIAGVVTLGSFLLGVSLARLTARWSFWGRGPLAFLALAPAVLP